jgi:hypothetical protein
MSPSFTEVSTALDVVQVCMGEGDDIKVVTVGFLQVSL